MRLFFCALCSVLLPLAVQAASPASTSGAETHPDQAIVVTQGTASVSLRDVDAYAQSIPPDKRGPVFNDPQRIATILHGMLSKQQLADEARKHGLDQDPLIKAQIKLAIVEILANERVDALRAQAEAGTPDLSQLAHERYMASPEDYLVPAKVDVKHILIGTKERSEAEARALAEEIHAELMQDPSTFAAKVEKYSDDPSKTSNHGVIHDATSSKVVEGFGVAAGKLETVGDISAPVKTTYGYHILKLVKRIPARQRSFDEVREQMVKELEQEYVAKKVQVHLNQIRSRAMDAAPDLVASLRLRYFDDATARALRAHYTDDPAPAPAPAPASSSGM